MISGRIEVNSLKLALLISGQCSHVVTPQIPENQRFSSVLRRYKIGTLAKNGLILEVKFGDFT